MHMDIHVSSNMRQLGTFWRQLRTKLGSRRHNIGNLWEHCSKRSVIDSKKTWKMPVKTGVLRISLGRLRPHFEAGRLQLGQKLLPNGSKLGPSCAILEPSWASWADVGALQAEVDPKSGQCCSHVGSKRSIWTILGRSTKCANYWGTDF